MIESHGFAGFGEKVDDLADTDMGKVALELGGVGKNDLIEQRARIGILKLHLSVPTLIQQIIRSDFLPANDEWDLDRVFNGNG